jgi:prevent-host-death family protein
VSARLFDPAGAVFVRDLLVISPLGWQGSASIRCGHGNAIIVATEEGLLSSVGVRELKDHLSGLLRRVRDGETLIITDRGLPIGELGPVANSVIADRARTLVRQGLAHWGGGKPKGLRHGARPRKGLVSDAVSEDRG